MAVINELIKKFIINIIDKFKWFLKMHIIENCLIECLRLFQETYIEKICKNLMRPPFRHSFFAFMNTVELLPAEDDQEISNEFRILYHLKIGFLFFTVIFMKPDIVFAVSRLFQFNVRNNKKYCAAVKQVLQYFYHIKNICIRYENNKIINKKQCLILFVSVNDASFANNFIDQIHSQNYIIKLLNKSIT